MSLLHAMPCRRMSAVRTLDSGNDPVPGLEVLDPIG